MARKKGCRHADSYCPTGHAVFTGVVGTGVASVHTAAGQAGVVGVVGTGVGRTQSAFTMFTLP